MSNQKPAAAFYIISLILVWLAITLLYLPQLPNLRQFLPHQPSDELKHRAKLTRAHENIRELAVALEIYHIDQHAYPDGEHVLHVLTTPVAYISNLPIDRYSTPKQPRKLFYYSTGQDWAIGSRGPDGDIDISPADLPFKGVTTQTLITRVYDVTNGTGSSGDLIRLLVDHEEIIF